MPTLERRKVLLLSIAVAAGTIAAAPWFTPSVSADFHLPNLLPFPNSNGTLATFSDGAIDLGNPFFQSLGTNGRSCGSCHQPGDGWSVSAEHIQVRFFLSAGLDPIFRTNDGSTCSTTNVSTVAARQQAYSLLLKKGLIRIELPVPANAEFFVQSVANPYGCNSTTNVSVYRRPLPSTNLRFLSTVMWDGRESHPGNTLDQNLLQQSLDATTGHAQGAGLTAAKQRAIVDFEMALTTAQLTNNQVGRLDDQDATGGPQILSRQSFFIGINDPLGQNPTGAAFNPSAMTLFKEWGEANGRQSAARRAVARGEAIFNTRPINITGVAGLNDALNTVSIPGTCTTCHDAPNVGDHSVAAPLNIGVVDPALAANADLPVFTLVNFATRATVTTTDPGRALISGKWADIGKTKGPILRGLSGRAPYFHNGMAANFSDVVSFYETRFSLGLTAQEKSDLIAFLGTL